MGGSLEGSGGGARELERRVEEIEEDLESLSSTVSTVRSENDEIDETVGEIEEDIRNLLGIYEMVTQGVNPFVDETDAFGGGGGFDGGGSDAALGLFDRDTGEDSGDSEGAFDDPDADSMLNTEPDADEEPVDPILESTIDEADERREGASESNDPPKGGRDFSDLKEEFDAEDDHTPASSGESVHMSTGSVSASEPGDVPEREHEGSHEPADESPTGRGENAERAAGYGPDRRGTEGFDDGFEYVDADELQPGRREPYLRSLPAEHVCDLLVMEWLEYLVETADVTDAARAIRYYERIDWISESVAEQLRAFLSGFGQVDRNEVIRPGTAVLERSHHTRSLQYVLRLADTDSRDVLLDRWEDLTERQLLDLGNSRIPTAEEGENGTGTRSETGPEPGREGGRNAQSRPRSRGGSSEGGQNGDRRGRSGDGSRGRPERRNPDRSGDRNARGRENRHDGRTGRSDTRSLSPRSGGRGTNAGEDVRGTRNEERTDGVADRETGRPFSGRFPDGR
ncbi:FlaD/FlaE family flagellar protein [Halopenitus salinus]